MALPLRAVLDQLRHVPDGPLAAVLALAVTAPVAEVVLVHSRDPSARLPGLNAPRRRDSGTHPRHPSPGTPHLPQHEVLGREESSSGLYPRTCTVDPGVPRPQARNGLKSHGSGLTVGTEESRGTHTSQSRTLHRILPYRPESRLSPTYDEGPQSLDTDPSDPKGSSPPSPTDLGPPRPPTTARLEDWETPDRVADSESPTYEHRGTYLDR